MNQLVYIPTAAIYPVSPQARALPRGGPPLAAPPRVSWNTRITTQVSWGSVYLGTNYKMYEHRPPARINSPVGFDYTFRNQAGTIIDLTDYVSVLLTLKRIGDVEETFVGVFDGAKTLGKVKYDFVSVISDGTYHAQFVVIDGNGQTRWGDPAQVKFAKNIPDLTQDEIMGW